MRPRIELLSAGRAAFKLRVVHQPHPKSLVFKIERAAAADISSAQHKHIFADLRMPLHERSHVPCADKG